MSAERGDADVEQLARSWYEADRRALYGHPGTWHEDREERLAYREAVERLMPAVQQLFANVWDEGWRASWTPMSMHGFGCGPNPYRGGDE